MSYSSNQYMQAENYLYYDAVIDSNSNSDSWVLSSGAVSYIVLVCGRKFCHRLFMFSSTFSFNVFSLKGNMAEATLEAAASTGEALLAVEFTKLR